MDADGLAVRREAARCSLYFSFSLHHIASTHILYKLPRESKAIVPHCEEKVHNMELFHNV